MDAARTPLSRKVFILLTAALLAAVSAFAAGNLNVNGGTSVTVPLNGANTSAPVSVTSTGDPLSFTPSIAYNDGASGPKNWLSAIPAGITPTTIYVNMTGISPLYGSGPFSATVTLTDTVNNADTATITVTYTPGGGGGTGGPVTVSPSPLGLQLNAAGSVQGTLTVQSSNATPTSFTVSTSTNTSGWSLTVDQSAGSVSASSPFIITVTASTELAAGATYAGTVTVTPSGLPPVQVNVTLTVNGSAVSANPANWTFRVALNGAQQSQTFAITAGAGTTLGNVTTDASWIQVGTVASDGSLPVTVDPTGLAAATYSGNVTVPSDAASSPLLIPIVMVISASGAGSGTQVVAPSALNLAYQINGPDLFPPTVTIPGTANQSFDATVDQTWIVLDPPGATLPASMLVHINPAGLAAQTVPYLGNISITTQNGLAVIPVNLLVTNKPVVVANPGSLTFWQTGSGYPAQKVDFSASDGSALTITPSAPNTPWVHFTMSPNAFTHGQTLTVSVDATGMSTGTFGGAIQVVADGFVNSPMTYPVALVVNGGGNGQGGPLTLSSSALTFNAVVNGASSTQTLAVDSNTGAAAFTAASQMSTGAGWLSISPSGSLTTEQDITVTANPSGLTVGTYSGTILLTANGATQQVQVSLVVSSNLTGGNVQSVPSSLNLTYQVGGGAPSAQLQVSNAVSGSAQIAFTVSAINAAWLTVTPTNAQTSATISVGVNTAGLTAGPYNGTIRIAPTGGPVVDVPVLLTVTAPSIAVDTSSLTFTYRAGDSKPASRTLGVTGGANANFTAQASSAGGWLSVTPASGVANPATLTVSVDPTGLAAGGSYQGGITVTGVNGTTGSATIAVTLNVMAPLPTIAGLSNAASGYSGSVSPGELISIYGTELGPGAPVLTQLDSTGKFVAATLGGVQVLVGGYPAPVTYASKTQVNAVVPYEVKSLKSVSVWVKFLNQTSNAVTLPLTATAPGVFTLNSSGSGPGLILNADFSLNGPANPAAKGGYVIVYVTGEGETLPNGTTGKVTVAQATPPYTPGPQLTVVPRVDGQVAFFNFAGEAPGFVSGLMQLNVQIPANARSGDLPITVSVGGNDSQGGVTVRVQ